MKSVIQWFFIIGSFVFLYWYMPEALRDNKVTLVEMATIGVNALCLLINLSNYVGSKLGSGLTKDAPDLRVGSASDSESKPAPKRVI